MQALLDLVAPPVCLSCGAAADGDLCPQCAGRIVAITGPMCRRCGAPGRKEGCSCRGVGGFERARSVVVFAEPARTLTLAMKRRGRRSTAAVVGTLIADLAVAGAMVTGEEVVTCVPAGRRSRRAGFDHAELIARSVAERLGTGFACLLLRAAEGPRQADVGLAERRSNVAGRFRARPTSAPVLLVDDVYTTGATAEACAMALRRAGAPRVNVVTWARTILRHSSPRGSL